jgi:catechol 2,3-dioxygenase-like lactoylglutathione lyase family enzyme
MKPTISDMVERYERGSLSRRDLIQGLSMLVAAATTGTAAAQESGMVATGIDHVSVRVGNLQRSAEFYGSLYGMKPLSEDKEHNILRLGRDHVIVSLRQDKPHGMIDHFGISVDKINREAATQLLKARGLTPEENWEYGYHVKDPDGAAVQMMFADTQRARPAR